MGLPPQGLSIKQTIKEILENEGVLNKKYDSQLRGIVDNADKVDGFDASAFEMVTNKGQANGYAPLDANALVPLVNIPAIHEVYYAIGQTDASTTSTTPVTMPDMNITFTLDESRTVIILFSDSSLSPDSVAWRYRRLVVDGVVVGGLKITSQSYKSGNNIMWAGALPAGTHTVEIQWWVGAGTETNNPASSPDTDHRVLIVIVLKR